MEIQECNEDSLIASARAGDVSAFKTIYELHINRVYGLCLRLCADKSLAEDAAQEVFIQLWNKLDNFDGKSKFSTWLHSVTSNVTISYIRKQRGWWQRMFDIEASDIDERSADLITDLSDLEKMIYRLPERARWVFVLHAIEGYRHEQIAETLDIAVGTSKVQFHRARTMIEEWMGNE